MEDKKISNVLAKAIERDREKQREEFDCKTKCMHCKKHCIHIKKNNKK